ncbi:MAG TPA: hypothetical protein VN902_22615 [Candidatus Acidoferrales bacterium]|jgi:hypothetical protein|nr:hypothetical protein [Candidatus Acidoferrales bacterium]
MSPAESRSQIPEAAQSTIHLPAPTSWPIVLAFSITLLLAGLVTSTSVSILGGILFVAASIGWFHDIFPQEQEETIKVKVEIARVVTYRREVERLAVAPDLPRALLPLETYPVSAGVKGGLAGSVAMAVLACLYGLLKQGSIWYPINLLAATAYTQSVHFSLASLKAFHLDSFLLAVGIHLLTSLLVGLLYGAMLPMIPHRPILLGGVVAPILWTGLLHSVLELLNPLLNQLISWPWFVASQFAFGIVAGLVVVRQEQVPTQQLVPFFVRAGFEAPGMMKERPEKDEPQ